MSFNIDKAIEEFWLIDTELENFMRIKSEKVGKLEIESEKDTLKIGFCYHGGFKFPVVPDYNQVFKALGKKIELQVCLNDSIGKFNKEESPHKVVCENNGKTVRRNIGVPGDKYISEIPFTQDLQHKILDVYESLFQEVKAPQNHELAKYLVEKAFERKPETLAKFLTYMHEDAFELQRPSVYEKVSIKTKGFTKRSKTHTIDEHKNQDLLVLPFVRQDGKAEDRMDSYCRYISEKHQEARAQGYKIPRYVIAPVNPRSYIGSLKECACPINCPGKLSKEDCRC